MAYIMILSTFPDEQEAEKMACELIKEKLVACCQCIKGVRSMYMFENQLCDEQEVLLIMKTKAILFDTVRDFIKKKHSYKVPEIISFSIANGDVDYLQWIKQVTR